MLVAKRANPFNSLWLILVGRGELALLAKVRFVVPVGGMYVADYVGRHVRPFGKLNDNLANLRPDRFRNSNPF